MKTLAAEARAAATAWIEHHARPLERSLYEFHFAGGPAGRVLDELAAFQNPDGGLDAHPVQMEMHDLLCCVRLLRAPGLPADVKARMLGKLQKIVEAVVERDPAKWKSYGLRPLMVIDSPRSPFAAAFRAEIDLNLDFLIEGQDPDGSWKPSWAWGDEAPEAWETARHEWTGVLTLDALRKLRSFGRTS